jgi:outer membrane lipoprotein SlyB
VTPADKADLAIAVFGSIVGGILGFFVTKKTHPVVGTTAGVIVGAILVPGAAEAVRK